ncbi:MAG: outer membrane lipoprotein-sorting protein [Altibacter sp.]|uniref:outer membrane lipoprotein-sorting protein n=1 Tax=Altibacter sp. TaxID=2024823 RepID=UPI001DC2E543|nr:outer membrane lipoprotein-sorting protein [Altibacter sp.]MBZ0326263.1 outer membrane lipoprotein-sorting protein [Altibacter sp.]
MKTIKTLFILLLFAALAPANAQTAEEIIATYLENIGGEENLKKVISAKFVGSVDLGSMVLPVEMIQTTEGYRMTKADVQGQTFYQEVYDGETLWGTNQMTMAAEKSDAEATENFKKNINDFPDPFLDYKAKGYTVELIGNETVEGTDTYKIKLVKEPIMVDGQQTDDISFYYFDTENFVPIVYEEELKSGQGKGMIIQMKYSDYQEVDGIYFPFSMNQGIKDQPGGQLITLTDITLNGELDKAMFAYPEGK